MIGSFSGILWVALGAAIGGPMRFLVSGLVARWIGETFPWGTLVVNVSGAFALGAFAALATARGASPAWLFVATGILGSYTTVSSFSLQTLALVRDGERFRAMANAAGSLALCLAAAFAGLALAQALA
jgi:CrcB protein